MPYPPNCYVMMEKMIRRDLPKVLEIERQCFEFPWTEEDFLSCFRQRNCIRMVAKWQNRIVGFVVYELHKSLIDILNFAVTPMQRRQGFGSQMIDALINKFILQRRKEICLEVPESNLMAQRFFRSQGLEATCILRENYEETDEDAYVMKYQLPDGAVLTQTKIVPIPKLFELGVFKRQHVA